MEVQLALGRELTQKNQQSESSESEDDEDVKPVVGSGNPWIGPKESLDEVFSGYKKFWEDHNANQEKVRKLKEPELEQKDEEDDESLTEDSPDGSDAEASESDEENPSKFINDLFDDAEDNIASKMEKKLMQLKPKLMEADKKKKKKKKEVKKKRGANVHDANYLGFQKKAKLGDVDEALMEGDQVDTAVLAPSRVLLKEIKKRKEAKKSFMRGSDEINPESFLNVKSKHLITAVPRSQVFDEADDEFDVNQLSKANKLSLAEAFEDDDIVNDFVEEVEVETRKNSEVDETVVPGWGSWGGHGVKAKQPKFEKKLPQVKKKDRIIIRTGPNEKLQKHLISSVPFPFKSVQDFEASMRLPIGRDFIPETAHRKLTLPGVVTKAGTVIEPMSEDVLVQNEPKSKFTKRSKKGKKGRK